MNDHKSDETFPELEEFLASERRRHRRFVLTVFFSSAALLAAGIGALVVAFQSGKFGVFAFACVASGLGVIGMVRAVVSATTDVDTRDRKPFDVPDVPLDGDDE